MQYVSLVFKFNILPYNKVALFFICKDLHTFERKNLNVFTIEKEKRNSVLLQKIYSIGFHYMFCIKFADTKIIFVVNKLSSLLFLTRNTSGGIVRQLVALNRLKPKN